MKPVTIRYSARQVSSMVATALHTRAEQIVSETGESIRSLKKIAELKSYPSAPVLEFLSLEQEGDGFSWSIRA